MTVRKIWPRVAPVVMAIAVTAGCADSPSADPTPSEPNTTTGVPLEFVRVTGTVVSGTEPGCLLLDTAVRRYQLVGGGDTPLAPGQQVTVTGLADPNTTSSCEQTIPLTVSDVDPAD